MCDLGRSDEKGPVAVLTLYSFSFARSSKVRCGQAVYCQQKVVWVRQYQRRLIQRYLQVYRVFRMRGRSNERKRCDSFVNSLFEEAGDAGVINASPEDEAEVIIKMWKNGFTINDGQLRDYTDAANRQFMDSMRKGELPPELHKTFAKKELSVNVEDRKSEHYFIRKKHVDPFSGEGHRLGSATPKVITKANGLEDGGEQSLPSVELKAGEPLTNVKIWLADGKRIVQKCNTTHRMEKDQEMKIVKEDEEIKTEEEKIKIEEENEEETKIEEEKSEEETRIEEEENAELGNNEEKIKNKDEEEYWDEMPSEFGDDPFWITIEGIPPSEFGDYPFWITIEEIEEDEDEEGVEENLTQIQLEESEEDEDEEGVEENVTQIQFEEREEDEDEEGVEEIYVETENIEHVKRESETEKEYEYDNIIGMEENEDETKIKQEKKKMNTEKGEMMKVEEDEEEEGMMKVEVDETMDKHETTSRRHKWWLPKSLRGTGTRNMKQKIISICILGPVIRLFDGPHTIASIYETVF
ncbi:uncharacterized protein LOC142760391 [Rhinoderma darwinii]|uniref:uncharacterized protein LOC142760391 n=1 Tax=Rhinoderma darwinii TaxID=43563 RepID=UPI003F666A8E